MQYLRPTAPADAAAGDPGAPRTALRVALLCAGWCTACREFLPVAQRVANAQPDIPIVWLDIEDDAAIIGDFDVEDFPTLVIARGDEVLHLGATLPHEGVVQRLLGEMRGRTEALTSVPPAIHELMRALRTMSV